MPSKNLGYILALLAGSCSRFSAEDDSLSEDEIIFSITTFPLSGFLDERDQAKEVTMSASTFYKRHCTYLPAMAGWFICSTALLTYNKVWYALISLFCDHKLNVLCEVLMMIECGRIGCSNLYLILSSFFIICCQ